MRVVVSTSRRFITIEILVLILEWFPEILWNALNGRRRHEDFAEIHLRAITQVCRHFVNKTIQKHYFIT